MRNCIKGFKNFRTVVKIHMNNLEKFKANNNKKPTNSANQMRSRRKQDFSSMHYWWLFTTLRRKYETNKKALSRQS